MIARSRRFHRIGVCVLVALAMPALAEVNRPIDELETLLAAQQQRLTELKGELVASSAQDTGDARREVLREQVREILSDREFRESMMPSVLQAGYDKGFFIRSSDDKFRINFHGRIQFRYSYYHAQSRNHYLRPRFERDDRSGFDVKRLRMHIDGHAFTPDLTYFIKMWSDTGLAYDTRILYAFLNYRFVDEFQVKVGMFQMAATRGGFQSSGNMQFVEYPETVAVFDPGEAVGVRLWGQLADKRFEYFFDVVNSTNGRFNRTITADPAELDGNPALAFRAVWHACGEIPNRDFVSWGDIDFKEVPCVDIGFHYLFNDDNGDLRTSRAVFGRYSALDGGFGVTSTNGLQFHQWGLDAAFKYQGFSLAGEYILRLYDVRRANRTPFAPLWLLTGEEATTAQHGAYLQAGYFLPIPGLERKIEAVARVGGIAVNAGKNEGTWFYTAGLNYYIQGNKVKLQTDITKIPQVPLAAGGWLANANDDALIWRVQLQFAF